MATATQVFGRDKEKQLLVGWLTKVPNDNEGGEITVSNNHVSIVSIVAHGGMGKTTLAQLICEDGDVTKSFEKVIWVCVSTTFDAKTTISKILQSSKGGKPDVNTFEPLQQLLSKELNSVKFLLVCDDVWEDKKKDQWEKVFAPLRAGQSGSKILLTTRMQSVADLASNLMGGDQKCLSLQGLEENDNIELFNHHAFSNLRPQDYARLQSIGEQIAKKVTGCPLVLKVVGTYLRDNMTFQVRSNFLHQSLEHFEGGNDKSIMEVLKLSYDHLPTELQSCFRYCSLFPQDYTFRREKIVNMWICSGLISQNATESRNLPDIGDEYLVELTKKSFFDIRIFEDQVGSTIETYVMHDLMHDLARFVSFGECARVDGAGAFDNMVRTTRHLSVQDIEKFSVEEVKKIGGLKHLRTILIMGGVVWDKDIINTVEEVLGNLKSLRLFETVLCHTPHFMGKLAKFKHLRYIKQGRILRDTYIKGVVQLYHLTVLDCGWGSVETEPKEVKEIGNNLDHLQYVNYGSYGFGNIPIAGLTSLRLLEDYQVQQAKGYTISALRDLKSLHKLGIKSLENVENEEEARDAKLKEKQHLSSSIIY